MTDSFLLNMENRTSQIDFALKTIPEYNRDYILVLFASLNSQFDPFEKGIKFLRIKSRITDEALDSIKYLALASWSELRQNLTNNFKDKTTSITIANEILNIKNIQNTYKLLEVVKEKFTSFKSRLSIREQRARLVIINFTEKLIVNHFIATVNDPFRNNLATRNPQTLKELETLLQNDFQYL